jgi:hypothetical protein
MEIRRTDISFFSITIPGEDPKKTHKIALKIPGVKLQIKF